MLQCLRYLLVVLCAIMTSYLVSFRVCNRLVCLNGYMSDCHSCCFAWSVSWTRTHENSWLQFWKYKRLHDYRPLRLVCFFSARLLDFLCLVIHAQKRFSIHDRRTNDLIFVFSHVALMISFSFFRTFIVHEQKPISIHDCRAYDLIFVVFHSDWPIE